MKSVQTLIQPSRDKKPYRLRCRFKIERFPRLERLDREKVNVAERFVRDMKAQGWVYDNRFGFRMTGPYPVIEPVTIHIPRTPSARGMMPYVAQGARFLDQGGTVAMAMPLVAESESWEYELAGVFVRDAVLVERPDLHEEERV